MNPNTEQLMSIVRWLLSVGGPVSSLLIARGMPADKVSGLTTALLTIIGALPPVVSFVWGMFAHTDKAKLQAVQAMPDVAKIVAVPGAGDGVAKALADPAMPKVVNQ